MELKPLRLEHRAALREVVGDVVRRRMGRKAAANYIASWTETNIVATDREHFREIAESELLSLHEGNFARYRIRPAEFAGWREIWEGPGGAVDSR